LLLPLPAQLEAAIADFDCCDPEGEPDEQAVGVRDYLRDHEFVQGIENGLSSTYIQLDLDEDPPTLLGYATVAVGTVKLKDTEASALGDFPFPVFPAVRLLYLGVDHRCQGCGCGSRLIDDVVGLARAVRKYAAVRFVLVEANPRAFGFYEKKHFVRNKAKDQKAPQGLISMRLDLGPPETVDAQTAEPATPAEATGAVTTEEDV
jgi:ribosomal protein S18 acetylase RimI-like enzyme